jgi:hypothetical protein
MFLGPRAVIPSVLQWIRLVVGDRDSSTGARKRPQSPTGVEAILDAREFLPVDVTVQCVQ